MFAPANTEIRVINPTTEESSDSQSSSTYAVIKWGRAWACFTPEMLSMLFPNFTPPQCNPSITPSQLAQLTVLEQLTVIINKNGKKTLVPITLLSDYFQPGIPEYVYISKNNKNNVFENTFQRLFRVIEMPSINSRSRLLVGAIDANSTSSRMFKQELVLLQKINVSLTAKCDLVNFTRREIV